MIAELDQCALAVDVVAAMDSQRDRAAKTIYVAFVITTMDSSGHWMNAEQLRELRQGLTIQFNRNGIFRHVFLLQTK